MLLANCTVAQKILQSFPHASCLRRHPAPTPQKFEPLMAALQPLDFTLDLTSNKACILLLENGHL